jgi:hypothetical protein
MLGHLAYLRIEIETPAVTAEVVAGVVKLLGRQRVLCFTAAATDGNP